MINYKKYLLFILILLITLLIIKKKFLIYMYNKYFNEITVQLSYNPKGVNLYLFSSENTIYENNYLEYGLNGLEKFINRFHIREILTIDSIPCKTEANMQFEYKIEPFFKNFGLKCNRLDNKKSVQDKINLVQNCEAIFIGNGNIYYLCKFLQDNDLLLAIYNKITSGTPFIGVGSVCNLVCPSLKTSFDLPIAWPNVPNCLNIISFQLCVDYNNEYDDQLAQYLNENKKEKILCLRKGQVIHISGKKAEIISLNNENLSYFYLNKNNLVKKNTLSITNDLSFLF